MSPLYPLCSPVHPYRQILVFMTQIIIGFIFITRTYALYDRSRAVLIGLTSLAFSAIVVSAYMLYQGKNHSMSLEPPMGPPDCLSGIPQPLSRRLAVGWGSVMIFDLVVIILTLVRTIRIKRRSGKDRSLTHVLIRDGVLYFGVINLALLSNIITLLYGTDMTRGILSTIVNVLASVLVSRLMFNLRESREHFETTVTTTAASSAPTSTILSHIALTNIGGADEDVIHESLNRREDAEIDSITGRQAILRHDA